MGAEGQRSFSEIRAARIARFISYREAMTKLAAACPGESLASIANELRAHFLQDKGEAVLRGIEQTVTVADLRAVDALLNHTLMTGTIGKALAENPFDSDNDPDLSGWVRSTFIDALKKFDLPCPDSLRESDSALLAALPGDNPDAAIESWMLPYKGRRELPLGVAARIMTGYPLSAPWNELPSEAYDEYCSWRDALLDAIKHGEIDASTWSTEQESQQMLGQESIRAWCITRKHIWPIPEMDPQPATDAELMRRLRLAEAERDLLVANNLKLENEADRLRQSIETLRANIADRDASSIEFESKSRRALDERDAQIAKLRENLTDAQVSTLTVDLEAAKVEIERLTALVPPVHDYLVPVVIAVQHEFWTKWTDGDTRPKANTIITWVREKFPSVATSDAIASAVDKVACPFSRDPSAGK